jgi:hypothetical protein
MPREGLDPRPILDTAHGFWRSQALCAACEFGLFTRLAEGPMTAAALAAGLGVPERSLAMLLNANAALGFLTKRGGKYANAPIAQAFLVKGKEGYLGDSVRHMAGALYARWGLLTETVRRGRPARDLSAPPPRPETARDFTMAMHGMSTLVGRELARRLDLRRCHQLLDIGGGSGVLSAKLAERFPNLEATILDLPEVCRVADDLCRLSPAAARLKTLPQSYTEELPRGRDVALLSQVLHAQGEAACRALLKRVHEALDRPGLIIIVEFALEKDKARPVFPALFALNMLINTHAGAAFSKKEILRWLREAGFRKGIARKLRGYATLFTALKSKSTD